MTELNAWQVATKQEKNQMVFDLVITDKISSSNFVKKNYVDIIEAVLLALWAFMTYDILGGGIVALVGAALLATASVLSALRLLRDWSLEKNSKPDYSNNLNEAMTALTLYLNKQQNGGGNITFEFVVGNSSLTAENIVNKILEHSQNDY